MTAATATALTLRVTVHAPARLHLGFVDPSGSLGRAFGSVGVAIEGFETVVELRAAARDEFIAATPAAQAELNRAAAHVQRLRERSGRHEPLALTLARVLPAHAGFGSGTQLALAVGRAFARWQGLDASTPQLAQWLGRGLRSGIGIAAFDAGGLVVDGGRGAPGTLAPVLARLALPAAWRIVVVQDPTRRGLAGAAEREALARLAPLPRERAAELCHEVLMHLLPGAADADFDAFAAGVSRLQQVLGEHYAPAQRGSAYASPAVARALGWMQRAMPTATGQSSWGPTGFAFAPSQAAAQRLVDGARAAGQVADELTIAIVAARHSGARIETHTH